MGRFFGLTVLDFSTDDGSQGHNDQHHKDLAVDAAEEDAGVPVGDQQSPAEVGLGHLAQHQAQQDGDGRQVDLAQNPGQDGKDQGHSHVKVILLTE